MAEELLANDENYYSLLHNQMHFGNFPSYILFLCGSDEIFSSRKPRKICIRVTNVFTGKRHPSEDPE